MLDQIIRLLEIRCVRIAIATGRGGSLGESLPERWWNQILVGYYNGAYLKSLAIDIRREPPAEIQAISDLAALLAARPELFLVPSFKNSRVQISIETTAIWDINAFREEFKRSRFGGSPELKVLDTGRTIDIVQADTCKSSVLDELRKQLANSGEILYSGDRFGNDHVLLGHAFGVSVGAVCDRPDACWSFFGDHLTGPDILDCLLDACDPVNPAACGSISPRCSVAGSGDMWHRKQNISRVR